MTITAITFRFLLAGLVCVYEMSHYMESTPLVSEESDDLDGFIASNDEGVG